MTNQVTHFYFEQHSVRTHIINDAPWFVAKDACAVLGIANPRDAVGKLDDDEKDVALTDTLSGRQKMTIISESGMYTLILRCRDAVTPGTVPHRFRKWVTNEVLPQIRKTGKYQQTEATVPQSSTILAPNRECLPKMVYHHQSKYNPYRAYAWNGEKNVYIGVYPTVDEAVAAQQRFYQNGSVKRIQKAQPEISEAETEMFIGNLRAICHNFRRIDEIWRTQLRPALEMADSRLVYLLHDRFNDSMCVLPTIEDRIGRYIPPTLPL
ncbi:Bro-N domain-containing protein [Salmonella enterica]|nr:Bro-N domain-containing protein [Salmonella enterica]